MVHGDVREERDVVEREESESPDFFPLYLGDGRLDRDELDWLHERRLRDIERADRILVPSNHIAETLARYGTPRSRISGDPLRRWRTPGRFQATSRKSVTIRAVRSCSPGGSPSGRGSKYLLEGLAGWSAPGSVGGGSSSWGPCRATSGRSKRYLG